MDRNSRFLFISDLQIPFEAEHALKFCKKIQKEFRIPDSNIFNVGDECDLYHGSVHQKDPDAGLTANQEFDLARHKLLAWYKAFPQMRLATSNHGLRWLRKAFHAEIPAQVIRCYKELLGAPRGWQWADKWIINAGRAKLCMVHGMGYSGQKGHINAAIDMGMSTIIGHLHSHAGINYLNTEGRKIFAFNTGCLIDPSSFAFKYGQYNRNKPVLGVGVVIDGGLTPIFIPYESL